MIHVSEPATYIGTFMDPKAYTHTQFPKPEHFSPHFQEDVGGNFFR